MAYLARVDKQPTMQNLSEDEKRTVEQRFDANAYEMNFDGQRVEWGWIDEVEIAKAAREGGPAGWIVKKLVFAGERYHIGVYFGQEEAVLTNVTLEIAKYVLATIAYYAIQNIRYSGLEGVVPVRES